MPSAKIVLTIAVVALVTIAIANRVAPLKAVVNPA